MMRSVTYEFPYERKFFSQKQNSPDVTSVHQFIISKNWIIYNVWMEEIPSQDKKMKSFIINNI